MHITSVGSRDTVPDPASYNIGARLPGCHRWGRGASLDSPPELPASPSPGARSDRPSPGRRTPRAALVAAGLLAALVVFIQGGWFLVVATDPDPLDAAYRDWIQFHRTGERVIAGAYDQIYPGDFVDDGRPEFDDGLYFMYPPFVAWVTVPLGFLPPLGAYAACVLLVVAATVAATLACLRIFRVDGERRMFAVLGTVASAPWNAAVILGHLSATLVVPPVLALMAWRAARPFRSGAALGLLLAKPNWGLPMLLLLAVGRRWRMLAGALVAGLALVVVSLPFGVEVWSDWWRTMVGYRALITDGTQPWRQATLFASLQSLLGRTGSDGLVVALWVAFGGTLFAGALGAWALRGRETPMIPRLIGVALLAVVATNPYAHFYDALLPLPAALMLWAAPETWHDPRLLRWARVALGVTWLWMPLQYLVWMATAPSLAGVGFSAWLAVEVADLWRGARAARRRGPGPTGGPRAVSGPPLSA
ncbi:MAG TPA: glycosyltransferase family 87 protein [Longimicrobiales bacterium]|nr:glycosyltransferase family 87 protein [Longimicrobiales bacterium]